MSKFEVLTPFGFGPRGRKRRTIVGEVIEITDSKVIEGLKGLGCIKAIATTAKKKTTPAPEPES